MSPTFVTLSDIQNSPKVAGGMRTGPGVRAPGQDRVGWGRAEELGSFGRSYSRTRGRAKYGKTEQKVGFKEV